MNHSEKVSAMFTLMGEDPPTSVSGLTPVSNYTADNASLEGALQGMNATFSMVKSFPHIVQPIFYFYSV
jgi:hypothetical protein